jgi:hypothetical protein
LLVGLDEDGRLTVERSASGAPEAAGLVVPWLPMPAPVRISTDGAWAPESWRDVVAVGTPIDSPRRAMVLGRDGGPEILDSELARLTHLTALAGVIRHDGSGSDSQGKRKHLTGTGLTQDLPGNGDGPAGVDEVVNE